MFLKINVLCSWLSIYRVAMKNASIWQQSSFQIKYGKWVCDRTYLHIRWRAWWHQYWIANSRAPASQYRYSWLRPWLGLLIQLKLRSMFKSVSAFHTNCSSLKCVVLTWVCVRVYRTFPHLSCTLIINFGQGREGLGMRLPCTGDIHKMVIRLVQRTIQPNVKVDHSCSLNQCVAMVGSI